MVGLVKEAWSELVAAYGHRWTVLSLLVAAVIARIDEIARFLEQRGMIQETIGIPDWVLAIIVFCVWSTLTLLWHAVKLRRQITPKFSLEFDPSKNCIEKPPTFGPPPFKPGNATYLRIRIEAESDAVLSECRTWITSIEKVEANGNKANIHIPHNMWVRSKVPFKVYPGITETADFLECHEGSPGPILSGNKPNILLNAFDKLGIYRFTLTVWGDGGRKKIQVDVDWRGQWNTMTARRVDIGP
jgi:hypothetical protein